MGQGDTAFIHDFFVKMMEMKATNAARARELLAKALEQKKQKQKQKQNENENQSYSVVGSVVWGPAYVDKFMNYCLPSLLAKGNIPALSEKGKVVHSIVTTETDRDAIAAHPIFARLSEFAEVVFTCFPEEFLERRQRAQYNFYHFYGLLDHQNVFLASALQADLYLLPIDCVYSSDSLKNFSAYLEKDADCCSVAGIEADEVPASGMARRQVEGHVGRLEHRFRRASADSGRVAGCLFSLAYHEPR